MNPERNFNFEYCCRTCLNATSTHMYSIFAEITHNLHIADIVNKCTTLDVGKEDKLPKKICSKCFMCIKAFHEFCVFAEAVDVTLKQQLISETYQENSKCIEQLKNGSLQDIKEENYDDDNDDVGSDNNISDLEIKHEFSRDHKTEPLNTNNNIESIEVLIDSNEMLSYKLKCEICNKKFRQLSNLNHHKKKHNAQTKCYTCDACLKIYTDYNKFVMHLNTHQSDINSEKYDMKNIQIAEQQCQVCSLMFQSKNALSAHMRKHAKKGRVLSCTICAKVFAKMSHLKRHELSHEVNHPFKCSLCPKTFALETSWKEHLNKHNGIKPHPCPMCSKSFSHLTTLTTHIRIHIKEKPYLCPTCGKRFDSSTNLNQHMKRHQGLKLFACTLCPRKFVSKGELKSHNITHTGERSFACEQCGATFTKRTSLAKHTMRHLGVKPHQCDTCPMKFTCKDHLKRHYRIHTGEKPYKCDMCERAFTQSNDLVKHRRAHLGDNLYKCSQCSQSFRLKTELRQHISDHFISQQIELLNAGKTVDTAGDPKRGATDFPMNGATQSVSETLADIKRHNTTVLLPSSQNESG